MGLFDGVLKHEESLFLEPIALDFDYQPKLVHHRESEQQSIASHIKPLFQKRNGTNLIITGSPGLGKTVCLKHVLREIEQETSDILNIYINCWKKDSSFKIMTEICNAIGFSWTHNKTYDELLTKAGEIINKKSAVIVLDEADKLTDQKLVYSLLEDLFRKTIILVSNNENLVMNLDPRVKSRIAADHLKFKLYNYNQIKDILLQRREYAFVKGVWDESAFEHVSEKTFESGDLRHGLMLMKEAGDRAETLSSRSILKEHVEYVLEKKEKEPVKEIKDESLGVLDIIKQNPKKSVLQLFEIYGKSGGERGYRTFHRRLKELEGAGSIKIRQINKGYDKGRTTEIEVTS